MSRHCHSKNGEAHWNEMGECLFVLFGAEPCVGICHPDGKLLSTFDECLALLGGHAMCNLSTVPPVHHHQHLQFPHVVNENFAEAVGQDVLGLLVASITDVGHQVLALEAPPHPVVNTFRFPPVGLQLHISVTLVADELLHPLFDAGNGLQWLDSHCLK